MDEDGGENPSLMTTLVAIVVVCVILVLAVHFVMDARDDTTCDDGMYTLIMSDGSFGGCMTPPINSTSYVNGTEITKFEKKQGWGNVFVLNNNIDIIYGQIVFHPILADTMQPRYVIEQTSEQKCIGDVYIGDVDCTTWISEIYHIYISMKVMNEIDGI